jgi:hypothetical protein
MFMARSSERLSADAYTRRSVEAYLQAAAEQRARIELCIAEAEKRQEAALDALERLEGRHRNAPVSTNPVPKGEEARGDDDDV